MQKISWNLPSCSSGMLQMMKAPTRTGSAHDGKWFWSGPQGLEGIAARTVVERYCKSGFAGPVHRNGDIGTKTLMQGLAGGRPRLTSKLTAVNFRRHSGSAIDVLCRARTRENVGWIWPCIVEQ